MIQRKIMDDSQIKEFGRRSILDQAVKFEMLINIDDEERWWPQCEKEDCANSVCLWVSDKYCYPHSKWYRPLTAKINGFITTITNIWRNHDKI